MPPLRVAVVGGGIAGLCLAATLVQLNSATATATATPTSDPAPDTDTIHVDIYEAAHDSLEVGAGLTLWGRVCEVLRFMGLEDVCVRGSVVVASSRGGGTTDGFKLRGFREDADYGILPFRDAWSLHRTELVAILAGIVRTPSAQANAQAHGAQIHFRKRLVAFHDPADRDTNTIPNTEATSASVSGPPALAPAPAPGPITLTFADNTTATCDVLVGADGLRSIVRAQLMTPQQQQQRRQHSVRSDSDSDAPATTRRAGSSDVDVNASSAGAGFGSSGSESSSSSGTSSGSGSSSDSWSSSGALASAPAAADPDTDGTAKPHESNPVPGPGPGPAPRPSSAGSLASHIHPRWTGTIAYRALVSSAELQARDPEHDMLKGGVVYFGKSQHIVGYPISPTTLNLAVNTTNLAHVDTVWPPPPPPPPRADASSATPEDPSTSPSSTPATSTTPTTPTTPTPPSSSGAAHRQRTVGARALDRAMFRREVAPSFEGWGKEVYDVIQSVDTCMEWPVMDLDPLPFYTRGRAVLVGDAAHAAVPYVGAGAAFAIEDTFLLAHLLYAAASVIRPTSAPSRDDTPHAPAPQDQGQGQDTLLLLQDTPREVDGLGRALETYEMLRRPRGNALVRNARLALRSFQFDGPCGEDMGGSAGVVCRVFEEAAGVRGEGGEGEGGEGEGEEASGVEGTALEGEASASGEGPLEEMMWGVARVKGIP